ncbi:hypothetical protein [Actinomadura rupiterrae]|uniref:hypothetical protein n=1 Tax=Actinomadura rupiterrae TaxID=559627 RepID=UPI0020A2BB02|nr:hypothetical protein [Actinomadura rupiterrae]MCP2341683.1 hypothetical protein [Actinomadura rupiterrae]
MSLLLVRVETATIRDLQQAVARGLAGVRLAITAEGGARPRVAEDAAGVLSALTALRDLRLDGLGRSPRRAPVARLLECRVRRLAIAEDDLLAALAADDRAAFRRQGYRFVALAESLWKVTCSSG